MSTAPAPKLICAQCGYENEPERVYCHNCGTKLDRSVLPRETVTQQESLAETRKRIRKLTKPGQWKATVKTFANTIISAALVAAIYLAVMPPPNLPTKEKEMEANIISGDIDLAVDSPQSVRVQGTGIDISQHMRTRVKNVQIWPIADAKGTFATISDGKVTLGAKQNLFGLDVYSTVEFRPTIENGTFKAEKTGMHFGRLGIPPQFNALDKTFAKLWTPLKRETQLVQKAKYISVTDKVAVLVTKP